MDKGGYPLTEVVLTRLRDYFIDNFDPKEQCCPKSICSKCRNDLLDISKGTKLVTILPEPYDFDKILPHVRRLRLDQDRYCECYICIVARTKSKLVSKRKRGRPSNSSSNEISLTCAVKMCMSCKGIIHRGISHKCNITNLQKNMLEMCDSVDNHTKEIVAYKVISDKVNEESTNSIELKTPGPFPLKVAVKPKVNPTFSSSDVSSLQLSLGASNRSIERKVLPFIRRITQNRYSVQSNTTQFLQDRDQQLSNYFAVAQLKLESGNDAKEFREVVYCTDVEELIHYISSKRDIDLDTRTVKVGIDGGGGFLKFCLSVYTDQDAVEMVNPKVTFADTSVKKIMIIAIAQDVKESYDNIVQILNILNIDKLSITFTYALDLKLANIIAGIQAHGSTHPCLWCVCPRQEFVKESASRHFVRSLGSVRELSHQFQQEKSNSDKVQAKDFKNCVHQPLVFGDDKDLFIHHIPPPELHLLLRITNKILKEMEAVSQEVANCFYQKLGIVKRKIHGGEFNGNMCKKILQNLSILDELVRDNVRLVNFVECLKSLNEVRIACFGSVLRGGFADRIKYFQKSYLKLNVSVTTSVHVLIVHVPQFCSYHKAPLGHYSEQASESVHSDFNAAWIQCGKVDFINKNYGKNLLAAIIRYNGRHV